MKEIEIKCTGTDYLNIKQIDDFQGSLKKISKKNLANLKRRIIEDGFIAPIFVWKHEGKNKIIDGHGRRFALLSLFEEGYTIPDIPVAFIEASDEADARKKLLAISSQYGEFDAEELSDWLEGLGADVAETLRIVDGDVEIPTDQEEEEAALVDPDPRTGEADRLQGKWKTAKGQLWKLDRHRIMCGDATAGDEVRFLLGGGGRTRRPDIHRSSIRSKLYRRQQSERLGVGHDRERRSAG